MRQSAPFGLCLLALCLVAVHATPVKRQTAGQCATECSGASTYFRYVSGKNYNYQYETETKIKLAGVSSNEAAVKIEANAQIAVISDCEFALKLSQVKITGATAQELGSDWSQELQKYTTRFSFDDGKVGELCPTAEEPVWSVNIKRAILSAFQNGVTGSASKIFERYENDVSGRCPTNYEVKDEGDSKIIYKKKDLVSCFDRMGLFTSLRLVPYEVQSNVQSLPDVDSKQICRQTIRRGVLTDASCDETHSLIPFRNKDKGGVIVTSAQKLHFVNEQAGTLQGQAGKPVSLHFDHEETELTDSTQASASARSTLQQLCGDEVRLETPSLFNELVYAMRKMNVNDLKTFVEEAQRNSGCPKSRENVLSALPMCGATSCVKQMAELLKKPDALNKYQKTAYYVYLALTPKVNKEMIAALTPLLTSGERGVLGVSTVIHSYCRDHPNCGEEQEVKDAVQKLTANLGSSCESSDDASLDKIVYSLKALGNIGHSTQFVDKTVGCLEKKTLPAEVRVAAIQSLRRVPCNARITPLLSRFADVEENVEIRLNAFLTLIKCANSDVVSNVTRILSTEKVHQVGSFVVSYFEQIARSSDPGKAHAQEILSSANLRHDFKSDIKKYSRFYEFSRFSNRLNIGGHVDGGLIFTPEGYLPRQSFFNLTVDFFGNAVNLLEIGTRSEGMEELMDDLFGPDGYIRNSIRNYFPPKPKATTNQKILQLDQTYGSKIAKDRKLDLALHLRVFGDEVFYKSVRNVDGLQKLIGGIQAVAAGVQTPQSRQISFSRAAQLGNRYFSLPTVSGLPLHLGINSTLAVSLNFSGSSSGLNVAKLKDDKSGELRFNVAPSAALECSAIAAIHIGKSKSGVRTQIRLHTSTAAALVFKVTNGETLKTSFELPKQKNEILQIESKVFTIKNNVQTEEQGTSNNRKGGQVCTPERFNKWIGIKICQEGSFHVGGADAPYFPLTGPAKLALTVEKTDANLNAYELSAFYKNTSTTREVKFTFGTPGSSVDREIKFELAHQKGQSISVDFKCPLKKINAVGTLEKSGETVKSRINIKVDDSKEYVLIGTREKQVTATGRKGNYKGEIQRPGQPSIIVTLSDQVQTPSNGFVKANADLKIENLFSSPVESQVSIDQTDAKSVKFGVSVKSPAFEGKLSDNMQIEGDPRNIFKRLDGIAKVKEDCQIEYKLSGESTPSKIAYQNNLEYSKQGTTFSFNRELKFETTRFPRYNVEYNLKLAKSPAQFETKFNWKDGSNHNAEFGISSQYDQANNKHTGEVSTKCNMMQWDHKAKFVYQNQLPQQFVVNVNLDTPQVKNIVADATFKQSSQQQREFKASLKYADKNLSLEKRLQKTGDNKFKSNLVVQWQTDKKLTVDSEIQTTPNDFLLKSVIGGIVQPEVTFNKQLKVDGRNIQSAASLLRGQQPIYDLKFNVAREGQQKAKITGELSGEKFPGRTSLDATVEGAPGTHSVSFAVKRDSKEVLKGQLVVPTIARDVEEKRLKVDLSWDKGAGAQDSLLIDLHRTKPSQNQWQVTKIVKATFNGQTTIDSKLQAKVSKNGPAVVANITLFKADRPVAEVGFGASDISKPLWRTPEYAVDVSLKTMAPYTPRQFNALVAKKSSGSDYDLSVTAELQPERRQLAFVLGHKYLSQDKCVGNVKLTLNEKSVSWKQTYEHNKADSSKSLSGELEVSGENNFKDKIIYDIQKKQQPTTVLSAKFQLPNRPIKQLEGTVELDNRNNQRKRLVDLKWSNNQFLKINTVSASEPNLKNYQATLESSLQGLTKGEISLKSDTRPNVKHELDAKANWNNDNKLRVFHEYDDKSGSITWKMGAEATVPNKINFRINNNIESKTANKKYTVDTQAQLNGADYQMKAEFDGNSNEGSVTLNTPVDKLKSAKAKVTKIGDNEYELKIENNGQTAPVIKAQLKLEAQKRRFGLEVTNVQKPFKTHFEHEYTQTMFLIGGELNTDPSNAQGGYALRLRYEKPAEGERDIQATLGYPARRVQVNHKRVSKLPDKFEWMLEVQPNVASNQIPAKIDFRMNKVDANKRTIEWHITDRAIPSGLHYTGSWEKVGNCSRGALQECTITNEAKLKYSADSKKEVSGKWQVKRAIDNGRPTYSFFFEREQQAQDIKIRIDASLALATCLTRSAACQKWISFSTDIMGKDKQIKSYKYKLSCDSQGLVKFDSKCPQGEWAVAATKGTEPEVTVAVKRNGEQLYEIKAKCDEANRQFLINMKNVVTAETILHIGSRRPSPDSFEIVMWHSSQKQKVEDINIHGKTSDKRLISTIYVRPGFRDDFKNYFQSQFQGLGTALTNPAAANPADSAWVHYMQANKALNEDIKNTMKPMFDNWKQAQDTVGQEVGLNVGPIRDAITSFVNEVRAYKERLVAVRNDLIQRLTSGTPSQTMQKWIQDFKAYYPTVIDKMNRLCDDIRTSFGAVAGNVANSFRQIRDNVYQTLKLDELCAYLRGIGDDLKQSPIVRRLIEFFQRMVPDGRMTERLKQQATDLSQQAQQMAAQGRDQLVQRAQGIRSELVKNENAKKVVETVEDLYYRFMQWFYSGDARRSAEDVIRWASTELKELVRPTRIIDAYLPTYSRDPQGIITVQIPLAGKANSLDDITRNVRTFNMGRAVNTVGGKANHFMQRITSSVRDVTHSTPWFAGLKSPLSSTGMVAGDYYYITFDGSVFSFAGQCDYLLARDFESGEFGIYVTYKRDGSRSVRNSIVVEYMSSKVEIFRDNSIKINDQKAELPWQDFNEETQDIDLQAYRQNNRIVLRALDGLTVDCDSQLDICQITVPRRYHGKSGGLLGTNDFEPNDDWMKPDRRTSENSNEFADKWAIGSSCSAPTQLQTVDATNHDCQNAFSNSSLQWCEHRVDPQPFVQRCSADVAGINGPEKSKKICQTAAAYASACAEEGLAVELPSDCVKCSMAGTDVDEGDTKMLNGAEVPKVVDIVFVVEQRTCMSWSKDQLAKIAQRVAGELSAKGVDVKFGLVGFNGQGVHHPPRFHTGNGQLSFDAAGVQSAVGGLEFVVDARRLLNDPLSAVQFAVDHYPFRVGTRKLLALFACENCGSGIKSHVEYYTVKSELLQMNIGLQLITTEAIQFADGSTTESIAVDAGSVYTSQGTGNPELRKQLTSPHDSCTVLAQETNGTVFSYSPKNLAPVMRLLVTKLSAMSDANDRCQICECQQQENLPRSICFPCELPRPASLTKDNTGFFNPFVRLQNWKETASKTLGKAL